MNKNPMAGEVIDPKEEPTRIVLLNGYSIKLPSTYYLVCVWGWGESGTWL